MTTQPRTRSQGFYQMNDTTEWHLGPAPKGAPASCRVLRVICGGKVVLRRVIDDHDAQQLVSLFEGRM